MSGITINTFSRVLAQTDVNIPHPLETPIVDPLIPTPPIPRPLSPLEKLNIRNAIAELNIEANNQLNAGNEEEAFMIWYRVLKLERILDRLEEIKALGNVGQIAWDKTRKPDVAAINRRLEGIQQEVEGESALNNDLLMALAVAYQQIRQIDNALALEQLILDNARQKQDIATQQMALEIIAELHLARFDYPNATKSYEELLTLARSQQDYINQGIYIRKLAEIYGKALQPETAVIYKENLADIYLQNQQIELVPSLKIAIGDDYKAIKQAEKASQNYQEAFALAWTLKQLAAAAEALTKLGDLYRDYDQENYALEIYQQLILVEQQSYNLYGLMNTYDRMGQIYLEQKKYSQALAAFQEGLKTAKSLQYQEDYFNGQIQKTQAEKSLILNNQN